MSLALEPHRIELMRDYYVEVTGERHDSHLHARLATDQFPAETAGS